MMRKNNRIILPSIHTELPILIKAPLHPLILILRKLIQLLKVQFPLLMETLKLVLLLRPLIQIRNLVQLLILLPKQEIVILSDNYQMIE